MGLFTSTPNYMEGDLSAQQARKAKMKSAAKREKKGKGE